MHPTAFKSAFDKDFAQFLAAKVRTQSGLLRSADVLTYVRAGERVALSGGKRARPMMAEAMYLALGGKDKKAIRQLGLGIELFHLFCLIHDDMIDGGMTRHGVSTVQASTLASLKKRHRRGSLAHHADSQAVLVGDLFFGWAYECFVQAARGTKNGPAILAMFGKMIDEVIAGQMIDVDLMSQEKVALENVERKNLLKTATYSFVRPLELGILLADSNAELIRAVSKFAVALGLAFQLQDDMLDIFADPHVTGKPRMADIADGAHTFLTAHLFAQAAKKDVADFKKIFGQGHVSKQDSKKIIDIFERSGALAAAEDSLKYYFAKATAMTTQKHIPKNVRGVLIALLEYIELRHS